jgi:hypothetical protein
VVTMDIKEVQEKKNILEKVIEGAINEFENITQTMIERVELDKIEVSEFGKLYRMYRNKVKVDVRMKERL